MAKRQTSLLSFCQSARKRQKQFENADDQDQGPDYSNCQDAQVDDSPEESKVVSNYTVISIVRSCMLFI